MMLENWISTYRRLKLDPKLLLCTKITKMDQKIYLRPEASKLLEEITGETFRDIGTGNDFLNRTPRAQELIGRIDKWHCIKFL
jgi:hypothetical protein